MTTFGRDRILAAIGADGTRRRSDEPLFDVSLRLEGVDTFVLSMAVHGDRVACGTIDGRLLLLRIEAG